MMKDRNGIHIFSALNRRYAFDLYRLQTYELSESAYNLLDRYLANSLDPDPEYPLATRVDGHELDDWLNLTEAGLICGDHPSIPEYGRATNFRGINSIAINVAEDCNLNCTYCFGDQGLYGRKTGKLMTSEVGRACVDWLIERSLDEEHLQIFFFGGEPLLNLPLMQELVEYANQKSEQSGKKVTYGLTTNATLLDEKNLEILDNLKIHIQISLDGVGSHHDVHRKFKNGSGSWKNIKNNLYNVLKNGRKFPIRATLAHGNIMARGIINELLDYGFERVFVSPATGIDGAAITDEDVFIIKQEFDGLAEQYMEWILDGKFFSGCSNLHRMVVHLFDPKFKFNGCGAGNNFFTIGVDGDIFLCMVLLYPGSPYRIGNVLTREFDDEMHHFYKSISVDKKKDCSCCWARYLCGNLCFARNAKMSGSLDKVDPHFCSIQMRIFELSLAIVAQMKEKGTCSITGSN